MGIVSMEHLTIDVKSVNFLNEGTFIRSPSVQDE